MTKQEEIKDWLGGEIETTLVYYRALIENNQLYDAKDLDKRLADSILSYLHSQGVVIKVERGLPPLRHFDFCREAEQIITQQNMLKAGYVAVEPLIEEEEG